ncbi:hypothetical protein Mgra_00009928 [Meloidogyne graminicola]|nr:hypothetical protein Mgra_00009928 [Meloidogyne graminicola]
MGVLSSKYDLLDSKMDLVKDELSSKIDLVKDELEVLSSKYDLLDSKIDLVKDELVVVSKNLDFKIDLVQADLGVMKRDSAVLESVKESNGKIANDVKELKVSQDVFGTRLAAMSDRIATTNVRASIVAYLSPFFTLSIAALSLYMKSTYDSWCKSDCKTPRSDVAVEHKE